MANEHPKISVVVPVFNEAATVQELHRRIVAALRMQPEPYEIIFVNDGSRDRTGEALSLLRPLKVVTLARNYGQTPALDAGIHEARGDVVVLLDADLQNDPNDILLFLKKLSEGCDVVVGWRKKRHDAPSRLLFSAFANFFARVFLDVPLHDFGCGLKAYRASYIKHFRLWGHAQVFLPAVAKERGARICEVPVAHFPRGAGSSKIRVMSMIKGSFDLLGIVFFVKYFSNPLRFFGGWGLASCVVAVLSFGTAIVLKFSDIRDFTETPLPVVGTLFAILGVILFMMGLFAEALLRMYYEMTARSPEHIHKVENNDT